MKQFTIARIPDNNIKAYLENEKQLKEKKTNVTRISKETGIDRHMLSRIKKEGYKKLPGGYFYNTENLELFLEAANWYDNDIVSYADIKAKYNMKRDTFINKYERVFGKKPERNPALIHSVKFNRQIFHDINTSDKAYWLGFILADGNIFRNELRIKITGKDRKHLMKFCKFINGDYSMIKEEIHGQTGNTLVKVVLNDKAMREKLNSYNLYPAKSCKEIPYYDLDPKFTFDYIRGILDGDGYIFKDREVMGFVGSEEVLTWIKKQFESKLINKLNSSVNRRTDSKSELYYFNIYGVQMYNCLNLLYNNPSTSLNRKRKLAYKKLGK